VATSASTAPVLPVAETAPATVETTTPGLTAPPVLTTTVPATTVPTTPPPTGPPSAENPATVLVIGDSFAGLWGPPLEELLDDTGIVETEIDYRMSTGLARPRRYDWFARVEQQLAELSPDIVATSFGGNDFVPLQDGDGDVVVGDPVTKEEEWVAEYQQRAGAMMDLLGSDSRAVVWVGTANHPDPAKSAGLALQDRAAKAAAAERPNVVFIDTWDLLAGRSGGWARFVIDPRDGQGKLVRMADGFHPNTTGSEILAAAVEQAIRTQLIALGATL
jgi:uncharacterized protein